MFADLGDVEVHRTVARAYADLLRRQIEANAETDDARRQAVTEAGLLEQRIVASYPFHPELLDLMYHRWGVAAELPAHPRCAAVPRLYRARTVVERRGRCPDRPR
jgi:hypothetical protein